MWQIACLVFLGISSVAHGEDFLGPLATHVLAHSHPAYAPIKEAGHPLHVLVFHDILNVADVDRRHNTVEIEASTWYQWDSGITWDPLAHHGVDMISLPCHEFWLPHVLTIDTANEYKNLGEDTVTVLANGTAYHFTIHRDRFLCDVSHVKTGAACHVHQMVSGFSKDQVLFDIAVKPHELTELDPVKYFKGSKYEVTGHDFVHQDIHYGGKDYQLWTLDFNITKKENHKDSHHSSGHHSAGHHSSGHHSAGHHSAGHHSAGHHSAGHHSAGHHSTGHHSAGHHSAGHHSAGHHSAGHHSPSHHKRDHHRAGHCSNGHHSRGHRSRGHHSKSHHSQGHHSKSHHGGLTIHYHS